MSSQEFKEENEREHSGSKSKKDLPPLRELKMTGFESSLSG